MIDNARSKAHKFIGIIIFILWEVYVLTIQTERLVLKKYCRKDLDGFYALKSEPLVWKYSSQLVTSSKEECETQLMNLINVYDADKYNFHALFLKDPLEYIGEAGIISYNADCNRIVVGYNLLPKFWGKGYCTEIMKELVKFSFQQLKVERIEALVCEENRASRKVLIKTGFVMEGLLRNYAYINNQYCNVCYFGIIREDFGPL